MHQKVVNAPVTQTTTGKEYCRQEDDLSSIGMSATNAIPGTSVHPFNNFSNCPTLGSLQGTIIQDSTSISSQQPPSQSIVSSSVFHLVTVPMDAQTTASSVTMESVMQSMEHRAAK